MRSPTATRTGKASPSATPSCRAGPSCVPSCMMLPGGEDSEPRSLLFAEIDAPVGRLAFFVTHFAWRYQEGSVRQAQAIAVAGEGGGPSQPRRLAAGRARWRLQRGARVGRDPLLEGADGAWGVRACVHFADAFGDGRRTGFRKGRRSRRGTRSRRRSASRTAASTTSSSSETTMTCAASPSTAASASTVP